jgi:hypothetical protein
VRKNVCFVALALMAAGIAQADSLNVRTIGSFDTPDIAYGLAVVGNYAYVADCASGLRIIDVSNPQSPFEAGFYDTADYARGVAVSGNYAYVAYGYSGLRVVDVSTHSNPVEVGACGMPDYAWGVVLSGNHAYVAAEVAGLQVVDISNPLRYPEQCDGPGRPGQPRVRGGPRCRPARNQHLKPQQPG